MNELIFNDVYFGYVHNRHTRYVVETLLRKNQQL